MCWGTAGRRWSMTASATLPAAFSSLYLVVELTHVTSASMTREPLLPLLVAYVSLVSQALRA